MRLQLGKSVVNNGLSQRGGALPADAGVEALTSHKSIAERLLSDSAAQSLFYGLLYDILKKSDSAKLLDTVSERD